MHYLSISRTQTETQTFTQTMQAIASLLVIVAAIILALGLGNWLPFWLPLMSPLLDHKPFNCRPCTTFHLLWMLVALGAYLLSSWLLLGVGLAIAFLVFFIVRYLDNKRIEK